MIYAVDFDGLLCEDAYPEIGAPKTEIIEHFKSLKEQGHKLILWTCREGQSLRDAINWCMEQGLHFDAYNSNLLEMIALYGNDCRKVGADFYCDDRNYEASIIKDILAEIDYAIEITLQNHKSMKELGYSDEAHCIRGEIMGLSAAKEIMQSKWLKRPEKGGKHD